MATKSITKNVVVRTKPLAKGFIRAAENAQQKSSKDVILSKTVHELKGPILKEIFGEKSKNEN